MKLLCSVMISLWYQGEIQTTEMKLIGTLNKQVENMFFVDFSEHVKDLPILGKPENYSNVELPKEKCLEGND